MYLNIEYLLHLKFQDAIYDANWRDIDEVIYDNYMNDGGINVFCINQSAIVVSAHTLLDFEVYSKFEVYLLYRLVTETT